MVLHESRPWNGLTTLPVEAAADAPWVPPAFGVGRKSAGLLTPAVNAADLHVAGALGQQAGKAPHIDRWLEDLSRVRTDREIDDAILAALELVDALFEAGEIQRCIELLRRARPEVLPTEVLIALLSATLPFRDQLVEARSAFYERVAKTLRDRAPHEVDALLDGLQ